MTCVSHPTGFTSPMLTFGLAQGTFWEQTTRPHFCHYITISGLKVIRCCTLTLALEYKGLS